MFACKQKTRIVWGPKLRIWLQKLNPRMMTPTNNFLANSRDYHKSVVKQNLGKNVRELQNNGSYFLRITQPFNIVELVTGFKKKVLLANIKHELYVGQS
jgi:hypothetical protein